MAWGLIWSNPELGRLRRMTQPLPKTGGCGGPHDEEDAINLEVYELHGVRVVGVPKGRRSVTICVQTKGE
jgi:hypothetical protein